MNEKLNIKNDTQNQDLQSKSDFEPVVITPKPTHIKPMLYAYYLELLKDKAKEYGYNLLLNGSMNRDLDLVAVQWIDEPKDEFEMIQEFDKILTGRYCEQLEHYCYSILPGKRKSYVININRGGHWNNYEDGQFYLDISVTPKA